MFAADATSHQLGVQLMNRSDACRFLADLGPADYAGPRLGRKAIGHYYDEVLQLQMELTCFAGRTLSRGLTFDSFRILLLKVALSVGLHFHGLVGDAVEAFTD